ncbi:MAG: alkene reductase [Rhodococcus sp. (in: high G+C Gram-positive bacteria)]
MSASQSDLFTPLTFGTTHALNRVVMAPMTRSRAAQPGDTPTRDTAEYYAQRASAGLIVTEGTNISPEGKGYSLTPGIWSDEQTIAWKVVTDAVHHAGGRIFCQLWHVGRISNRAASGTQPVAPSAITAPGISVWVARQDGTSGMAACEEPREMDAGDITRVVNDYAAAAANALRAGFDGVELHGANGYLIDQFLRSTTNFRTDSYGGDRQRRTQFLIDVVDAVSRVVGPGRVGVRLSPFVDFPDTRDPEIWDTTLTAASRLCAAGIAYLHIAESDVDATSTWDITDDWRQSLRAAFSGPIIVAHNYNRETATAIIATGLADAVAFGRPYIANPDLVERFRSGYPLSTSRHETWYGGTAVGYTDYPRFQRN